MKPKFKAKITDGKVIPYNPTRLQEWYKHYEGKDISITIDKWSSIRTIKQNAYLHGVLFKSIADYQGNTITQAKIDIKVEVGFFEEFEVKGEKFLQLKQTSKLSKKEFNEFVDVVRQFAKEFFKLNIPLPDSVDLDELYFYDNN